MNSKLKNDQIWMKITEVEAKLQIQKKHNHEQ